MIIDSGTLATGEGTITATPTTMGDYDTIYSWRVSVVDPLGSNETVVETYQFTTRPENYAPTIGSETPGDGATHVPLNPELSVDVSDLDGDDMDITFETDASGPWQTITSYTGVGNGVYNATPTNMDQYATPYNWRVTVDDGHTPVVANYSFTTLNEPGSWWDPNWGYRKKITIDHTLVDEDLTNFTVLIDLTDTDLAAHAQAGGGDIAFTNNHGVKLSHEIELYDNGSGDLLAWVEVPFLSSSEDTILYMYFGNPGAADQQDVEGAWDENYVMVHHLHESSGTHFDSTANNNDSTDIVVSDQNAAGIVDGADEFDGTDDYIRVSNDTSLQFGDGSFTAETWINPQSAPDTGGARIINDRGTGAGGSNIGYQLKIKNDTGRWRFSDTAIDDATGNYKAYEGTTTYNYGQWHHVVMVYAADNELRLYVDGIPDGTLAVGTYGSLSNSLPTAIGAAISANGVEGTYSQWFDGFLDEIRLSDVARSAGWISTSHTNQSDPVSFISLGNLELESGPPEVSNPNPADGATSVSLDPSPN